MSQKLYVMKNMDNGLYKIGISKDPLARARQISCASGQTVKPVKWFDCEDALSMEKSLHLMLKSNKKEGEWFDIELYRLLSIIRYAEYDDKCTSGLPSVGEFGVMIVGDRVYSEQFIFLALSYFVANDGYDGSKISFSCQGGTDRSYKHVALDFKTVAPVKVSTREIASAGYNDDDILLHFTSAGDSVIDNLLFKNCVSADKLDLKIFVGSCKDDLEKVKKDLKSAESLGMIESDDYWYLDLSGLDLELFKRANNYNQDNTSFTKDKDRFFKILD